MSIPAGWDKVPDVSGYMSGVERLEIHADGPHIVITTDALDEEAYPAHDCDQMGCGWSHVLVRLQDDAAVAARRALGRE